MGPQEFAADSIVSCKHWFQRPKTAAEQLAGSLKYHLDGTLTRRAGRIFMWQTVLVIAAAALVCFYGVGIISTNSTFSPIFVQYFYWVAIFWSLISSCLLSWIVMVFDASRRDAFGAFLSAIAIWLVVIQVSGPRDWWAKSEPLLTGRDRLAKHTSMGKMLKRRPEMRH